MKEIIIQVHADRKLSKKVVDIGNMQESGVTKLIFELDEDIVALGGSVYLITSYDGGSHTHVLKDNSIELDRSFTQRKKTETNIVVSTSKNTDNPLDGVVWISNTLMLTVDKNNININSINEEELPPSLKIIYDELFILQQELENKKEQGYWNGKSAYEYAVDGGYTGTEKEFAEKLAKEYPIENGTGESSLKIGDVENNVADGKDSLATGFNTQAHGIGSLSGGKNTVAGATGKNYSVALGNASKAPGDSAFAMNYATEANGNRSFAINNRAKAKADDSFAAGLNTVASSSQQFVHGKCNIEDTEGKYVHIIGNGTSNTARSNAYALDWEGNAYYQGDVYMGGTRKVAAEDRVGCRYETEDLVITYAEETDGIENTWVQFDDETKYYKCSELSPTLLDEVNEVVSATTFHVSFDTKTTVYNSLKTKEYNNAWAIYSDENESILFAIIVTCENATVAGVNFAEKGIYLRKYSAGFVGTRTTELCLRCYTEIYPIQNPLLISDAVKTILSNTMYLSESEKKAIRDALGITALIESLQTQSETE